MHKLVCLELPAVPGWQNPHVRPMVGVDFLATVVLVELNFDDMKLLELEGVSISQAVADGRLLKEKSCHYFSNYKHDAKRQTIEILMLLSDWEALPRYTVGFVLLKENAAVFSEACFVKETAEIRRLRTTSEPPPAILQDGSSIVQVTDSKHL